MRWTAFERFKTWLAVTLSMLFLAVIFWPYVP